MSATAAFTYPCVPVGEYLGSVYRPDVDYVDGQLEERNVGEIDHATLQKMILMALTSFEAEANVFAIQEARVQTQATRFRVPDVCLLPGDRVPEKIITEAPLLCVEVLSPRDSIMKMRHRCMDYLQMGVPQVWVFDPEAETVFVMQGDDFSEQRSGSLKVQGVDLALDIEAVFEAARKRKRRI